MNLQKKCHYDTPKGYAKAGRAPVDLSITGQEPLGGNYLFPSTLLLPPALELDKIPATLPVLELY